MGFHTRFQKQKPEREYYASASFVERHLDSRSLQCELQCTMSGVQYLKREWVLGLCMMPPFLVWRRDLGTRECFVRHHSLR